jgi:hypothetical protein
MKTLRNVLIAAGAVAFLVGAQIAAANCGGCPGDKAEVKADCPADCAKECCAEGKGTAKCDASKAACPAGDEKKAECDASKATCPAGAEKKAECAEKAVPAPK